MQQITKTMALCAAATIALSTASAKADWDVGDPHKMHYPQLPDLGFTGMDVLASRAMNTAQPNMFKLLADDWRCSQTGPVSDIHIWGSWLDDRKPLDAAGLPDAGNVSFKLSIHADIPVSPSNPFSQPGALLWSQVFAPGSFKTRLYTTVPQESFYDPNIGQIVGIDHEVWQYNFDPIANPFIQQVGTIYWLDVQAIPHDVPGTITHFGWKTTDPFQTAHFNDAAVFTDTLGFNGPMLTPPGWTPMVYPAGHQYAGLPLDQAFVITPEPGSALLCTVGLFWISRRRRTQPAESL
jgi:hypothetical protein